MAMLVGSNSLSRLIRRFTLYGVGQTRFVPVLAETIVPITNVDALLQSPKVQGTDKDLTPAAGTPVTYFTTPANKRWEVYFVWRQASSGSTRLQVVIGGTRIRFGTTGTAEEVLRGPRLLIMEQNDTLEMLTSGNAGDGSISVHIAYTEEDAF